MLHFLCAEIGVTWELPFEIPFIHWLQSLGGEGSFLFYLMNFLSLFGEETLLVGLMGLVYWGLDKTRGERIGFAMLSASLLTPMVKNVVRRTRPFDSHPDTVQNLRDVDGYSFPSGHSSGAASLFVGVATQYRRKWTVAVAVVLPLLVALSRNYLGAHYLTDVAAGLALGTGIVFLTNFLLMRFNKFAVYGVYLAVGFCGMFYCTTSDYFTAYGLSVGFVLGILFENKVVHFENTTVWWRVALRVLFGGALFLGLNEGMKAIVGAIFDYKQHVIFERVFRTVRYAVTAFLLVGVYPMLFAVSDKMIRRLCRVNDNVKHKKEPAAADVAAQVD